METIMNNYHLEGEIGRGSFSRVYKARDLATQSHVVIKYTNLKPKPGAPTSATDPQLLKEEIEVLRKIQHQSHSNVCCVRDVMCSRDGLFVVEEFCSKGDLLTYLGNNSAIPESQIRHLFWQVLKGVEHLHQIGIVHRDIKLENIMLDNSWHPKLTDFNLSAFWSKDRLLNRFCGSLSYSAPEIFLLVPYIGPELDVWSLGVLLYGLFYSKFPFVAEDGRLDTLRKKVVACQLTFPSTRANDQLVGPSSEAVAVMKAMMTVDPSQRVTIEKLKRHSWFKKEREMDLIRGKKVVTNGVPGAPAFGDNKWRLLGEVAPKALPVQQGAGPIEAQPAPKASPASHNEMRPKVRHLNIPQRRENASPRPLSPTVRHMKSPRIEFQTEIQLAPEPLDERHVVHEVLAKLEAFGDNKQAAKEVLPEENAHEELGEERETEEKEKEKEHQARERQKEKECEKEKDKEKERYLGRSYHSAEKLRDFKKGKEAEDVPCPEKKQRQRRGSTGSGSRIERTKEWLKLVLHK